MLIALIFTYTALLGPVLGPMAAVQLYLSLSYSAGHLL